MTQRTRHREHGASAVEYVLLAAGVAALLVLVIYTFGGRVGDLFHHTCDVVTAQTGQTSCSG